MLTPATIAKMLAGTHRDRTQLALVLVERIDRAVYFTLRGCGQRAEQHEDMVQEALIYVYRDDAKVLRRWDPVRAGLRGYLNMVISRFVRRRVATQTRQTVVVLEELPDVESPRPEATMDDNFAYRASLEELYDYVKQEASEKDRERFWALYVEEGTPADVAQQLGVTTDALYTWASRFKKRLHQALPHLKDVR
jgi:RNA polymerase sigma factor (sigma-70 family)